MKWTSWAILAFVGSLVFLVPFIADRQTNAGVDRLSRMSIGVGLGPLIGIQKGPL